MVNLNDTTVVTGSQPIRTRNWSYCSDTPLQRRVLLLELFQTLRVVGFHAAVLVAPPVVGLLRDTEFTAGIGDGVALAEKSVGLTELPDDLLRGMTLSLIAHRVIHSPHKRGVLDSHSGWT